METRWNQMKLDPIGLQCEIHHRWCSDFHCPTIYGSKAAPAPTPGSYLRGGTSQTSNAAQCHRSGQSIQSALASCNTGIIWHNLHSFQLLGPFLACRFHVFRSMVRYTMISRGISWKQLKFGKDSAGSRLPVRRSKALRPLNWRRTSPLFGRCLRCQDAEVLW